ncbi:MAG: thioredoxin family protein [Bacteroidota bacterium]|nr:thioredoxin family protein [Bacteroidota bacterium]
MKIHRPLFPVFLALLLTTAVSAGQGALDWEENAQFGVEISGDIDITAQVFQPTNYQPYLILTSEKLKSPLLIDLGKKKVYRLKDSDVRIDGSFLATTGIPKGTSVSKYAMKGGASTFKVDGRNVAMTVRQTLVGEVDPAIILAHSPDYAVRKDAYKPGAKSIRTLKSYKKSTDVVVMFATWCSTCKLVLPKVLRVFEEADNRKFSVRYIGIAMGGNEPHAELERYGHDYPAVILLQNGKELDRIVGDPPGPIEDLIVNILR